MLIAVKTYELEIGDVWNGRRIIRIDQPPPAHKMDWMWMVVFEGNNGKSVRADAKWEVIRKIERIEL